MSPSDSKFDRARFYATVPRGAEDLLVAELRALGLEGKPGTGGVEFSGSLTDALRVALWSRTASRLLLELGELAAADGDQLYASVRQIDWTDHLAEGATLAVRTAKGGVTNEAEASEPGKRPLYGHFAALRVKDAIVDQLRERWGSRPDVDTEQPDLLLRLHQRGDRARLSVDLSGDGLHRRGYRVAQGAAPLRENLAAAVLLRAGWPALVQPSDADARWPAMLDPFCGAATLLIEAAWIAADVAPGLSRTRWGFDRWPQLDRALWSSLLDEARSRRDAGLARLRQRGCVPLWGYDSDPRTIRAAIACIEAAGLQGIVHVERRELAEIQPPKSVGTGPVPGLIVTNPPWGERLGVRRELERVYAQLGELLRERFSGWEVAVLAGDPGLGRFLGVTAHHRNVLHDGPIACQVLRLRVPAAGEAPEPARPSKPRSEGASAFSNRLAKNRKRLRPSLEREGIECYRIYDADIPEYNLAVDIYRDVDSGLVHAHAQEYAPPRTIDPEKARVRLREALAVLREDLELPRERVHLKRRERQRGAAQYQKLDQQGHEIAVREGPARFWVNLDDYLDTGLFLDHRPLRAKIAEWTAGKRLLNLFCYTATASVHAALGGARSTTSVDLSRTYLDWAQRNFQLNHLVVATGDQGGRNRLIRADVMAWLRRPERERWDVIFCDPPSFSVSKKMQRELDVQRDHPELIARCMDRLALGGLLIFSTNLRTFELDAAAVAGLQIEDWTKPSTPLDFKGSGAIHRCFLIRR